MSRLPPDQVNSQWLYQKSGWLYANQVEATGYGALHDTTKSANTHQGQSIALHRLHSHHLGIGWLEFGWVE
jgi:hypothetical protein